MSTKRTDIILYPIALYLMPTFLVLTILPGSSGYWLLMGFLLSYLLEACWGNIREEPIPTSKPTLHPINRASLFAIAPITVLLHYYGISWLVSGPHGILESMIVVLAFGSWHGLAFCGAHELVHKITFWEQFFGNWIAIVTNTGHAAMEHILYHHNARYTCTDEDHVFAEKNLSYYRFFIKAAYLQKVIAWQVEKNRLMRLGRSPWHFTNRLLVFSSLTVIYTGWLFVCFGWFGLLYILLFYVIGLHHILAVAYIQHYGLKRRQVNGQYEPLTPLHSWNTNNRFSNYAMCNLPRHSFHHDYPYAPFDAVQPYDMPLPTLPFGYSVTILLVLFPPLLFRIMNPRVEAVRQQIDALNRQSLDSTSTGTEKRKHRSD